MAAKYKKASLTPAIMKEAFSWMKTTTILPCAAIGPLVVLKDLGATEVCSIWHILATVKSQALATAGILVRSPLQVAMAAEVAGGIGLLPQMSKEQFKELFKDDHSDYRLLVKAGVDPWKGLTKDDDIKGVAAKYFADNKHTILKDMRAAFFLVVYTFGKCGGGSSGNLRKTLRAYQEALGEIPDVPDQEVRNLIYTQMVRFIKATGSQVVANVFGEIYSLAKDADDRLADFVTRAAGQGITALTIIEEATTLFKSFPWKKACSEKSPLTKKIAEEWGIAKDAIVARQADPLAHMKGVAGKGKKMRHLVYLCRFMLIHLKGDASLKEYPVENVPMDDKEAMEKWVTDYGRESVKTPKTLDELNALDDGTVAIPLPDDKFKGVFVTGHKSNKYDTVQIS